MKKFIIIAIVALIGLSAKSAEIVKAAGLSTAVTNTVSFTARDGYMTEPILFVSATANTGGITNTPVITVNPFKAGAPNYTAYTGAAQSSNATVVVNMNSELPLSLASTTDGTNVLSVTQTASPRIVLLPGDILTITGKADTWSGCSYYMQIKETQLK